MQEGKVSEEALQIPEERREAKRQGRKGKIYPTLVSENGKDR